MTHPASCSAASGSIPAIASATASLHRPASSAPIPTPAAAWRGEQDSTMLAEEASPPTRAERFSHVSAPDIFPRKLLSPAHAGKGCLTRCVAANALCVGSLSTRLGFRNPKSRTRGPQMRHCDAHREQRAPRTAPSAPGCRAAPIQLRFVFAESRFVRLVGKRLRRQLAVAQRSVCTFESAAQPRRPWGLTGRDLCCTCSASCSSSGRPSPRG